MAALFRGKPVNELTESCENNANNHFIVRGLLTLGVMEIAKWKDPNTSDNLRQVSWARDVAPIQGINTIII